MCECRERCLCVCRCLGALAWRMTHVVSEVGPLPPSLPPSLSPPHTHNNTQEADTGSMSPSFSSSSSSNSSSSSSTTTLALLATVATTAAAALLLYKKRQQQQQPSPPSRPLPPLHVHLDLKGVSVRESDLALFRSLLHPSITLTHGQEVDSRTQLFVANFPSKGNERREDGEGRREGGKETQSGRRVYFLSIKSMHNHHTLPSLPPSLRNSSPPSADPTIPHLPFRWCPPLLPPVLCLLPPLPLLAQPSSQRSSHR